MIINNYHALRGYFEENPHPVVRCAAPLALYPPQHSIRSRNYKHRQQGFRHRAIARLGASPQHGTLAERLAERVAGQGQAEFLPLGGGLLDRAASLRRTRRRCFTQTTAMVDFSPMFWTKWIIVCWIAVCLPVNTVMSALMPVCVNGKPLSVSTAVVESHSHVDANGQTYTHGHTHKSDACKIACEKCDLCSQVVVEPPAINVPALPMGAQLTPLLPTLAPQHIPHLLYRPPLA